MRVPCDAGADDDGRRNLEPRAGEIDRLDGLDAFQLVNGQGMTIDTVAAERRVTWPAITQQPTWGGDSLQIDNLGVLEGGCESDHNRHVPPVVGEVVIGQAVSEWAQASTLSGFRSVIGPAIPLDCPTMRRGFDTRRHT